MIKRIGIIVNQKKKRAVKVAEEISNLLRCHNIKIFGIEDINKSQLVIVIGGDGMVLHAAQIVHPKIPVLPIYLGSLGFLSQINSTQFKEKFRQIVKGNFKIENRMMLQANVKNLKLKALNDFVVERKTHRAISLNIHIGEEKFATYLLDGLIIATPTGSTAYSLAAGGPVVNPLMHAMILTPISAHTLISRPFVLTKDETIKVFPKNDCFLTIDGQEKISIKRNTPIIIKRGKFPFKLVSNQTGFYGLVKLKLGRFLRRV